MALLRCDFFSDVLGTGTSMSVILPQPARAAQIGMASAAETEEPPPVLYLLHGLSDDATTWTRRTSIERYATERGLAVVMPQVGRSFYVDTVGGERYGTFLTEELPAVVQRFFRVSDAREDTFVTGLSMGGYGAMRWALTHPHRFAAAASLSGALDVATLQPHRADLFPRIFGEADIRGTEHDLLALLERADIAALPPLYAVCGTEDELLPTQEAFASAAERAGADLTAVTRPGRHEWGFWDATIQDVLAWLPVRTGEPSPA
ncbi:alpha/beta hydrolase [Georgenia alba]|uniref:Alpha/beta hydrolase n=1 Tax=Georgenia alba TaxID=2233858 RepID=A0ABW2QHK0_9MICO